MGTIPAQRSQEPPKPEIHCGSKTALFEVLKPFLYPANEKLPAYEVVADQLKVSVAAVKTLIHRFRKRYTALVREEVIRTVPDSADVDAEIFVKL